MNLFAKDKELIFKIVNGILLIWFIAAIIITTNSVIDYVLRDPVPTYQEFRSTEMKNYPDEKGISDKEIKLMYDSTYSYQDVYSMRRILTGGANIIIVGGALYFLNRTPGRKSEDVEKKEE